MLQVLLEFVTPGARNVVYRHLWVEITAPGGLGFAGGNWDMLVRIGYRLGEDWAIFTYIFIFIFTYTVTYKKAADAFLNTATSIINLYQF